MNLIGKSYTVLSPLRPDSPPATVVLMGAARGGTSAIAGLLRLMNIDMGSNLDPDNNEDIDILVAREPLEALIKPEHADHAEIKQRVRHLFSKKASASTLWGWKDTLTPQYLPIIFDQLENPVFIAVFRDFSAIASGEYLATQRDHFASLERAQRNYASVLKCLKLFRVPQMVISYDKALRNPVEITTALAQFTTAPVRQEDIPRFAEYLRPEAGSGRIDPFQDRAN